MDKSRLTFPYHSAYRAAFGGMGFDPNQFSAWHVPKNVIPAVLLLPPRSEGLIGIQAVRERRTDTSIEIIAVRILDRAETVFDH